MGIIKQEKANVCHTILEEDFANSWDYEGRKTGINRMCWY